ncbi:hypothetical protein CCACVL1_06179 [Corchorus capsularis]|uniref:Uncharacterized protein n=1 Tax=Corchorus capsularis TaxID=210143 RepID=A0A1R3JGY8_COCAP|nr:hypothetical protein CCACVL1_06179 [Corchorus capsularis]
MPRQGKGKAVEILVNDFKVFSTEKSLNNFR